MVCAICRPILRVSSGYRPAFPCTFAHDLRLFAYAQDHSTKETGHDADAEKRFGTVALHTSIAPAIAVQ